MEEKKPDLNEFYKNLSESANLYADILKQFSGKLEYEQMKDPDPLNISEAYTHFFSNMASDPNEFYTSNLKLYDKFSQLWLDSAKKFLNDNGEVEEAIKDKRFSSEEWQNLPWFSYVKDSYLTYSDWLYEEAEKVEGLDAKEKKKLEFFIRQYLSALSPSNFIWTNPQVLKETLDSNAENLVHGLQNLAKDLKENKIAQTDMSKYTLGENLAVTKGQVVFQNDLLQLIQYEPSTKEVYKTPLLFIPAWINKYYIADLQEHNSLVKWLVDQGYTVFMISWVNPTKEHKDLGFEDYALKGLSVAIDEILKIAGEKQINAMGYCLGGTLLATTLAYMNAKKDKRINSASFLTTLLDFSDAGEISVFIDEEQIESLEKKMDKKGYLDGSEMALTFSMLRANDLIWSFVVNNYLLGKTPFPFDILYWNSDSTRMPAKMHSWYLRNMYLNNNLVKGKVELDGVKIDLKKISNPAYFLSTEKDHISPWQTTYEGTKLLKNATFTLAESGHVAGVVNPPSKSKYGYYEQPKVESSANKWFESAKKVQKSWWESWHAWNKDFAGGKVKARKVEKGIEAAPGSYVKEK